MAKKQKNELFSSLLYIVVGVLLAIFRNEALGWAMTIVGVLFIISGILDLIKKNLVGGAISLIIGIAIIALGWVAVKIVLVVFGILIAIKGLIALLFSAAAKKIITKRNLIMLFPAALISAIGYYLYEALITMNLVASLAGIPGSLVQAVASSIAFVAAGLAMDKYNLKSKLLIEIQNQAEERSSEPSEGDSRK